MSGFVQCVLIQSSVVFRGLFSRVCRQFVLSLLEEQFWHLGVGARILLSILQGAGWFPITKTDPNSNVPLEPFGGKIYFTSPRLQMKKKTPQIHKMWWSPSVLCNKVLEIQDFHLLRALFARVQKNQAQAASRTSGSLCERQHRTQITRLVLQVLWPCWAISPTPYQGSTPGPHTSYGKSLRLSWAPSALVD